MKKAVTLLVVMYIYLSVPIVAFFLVDNINDTYAGIQLAIYGSCLIFLLITGVFNIISAVELYRARNYDKLRSEMKLLKMGLIPFFVVEYIILVAIVLGFSFLAVFFFWTVAGPIVIMLMVAVAVLISYIVMLISSVYGVAFISLLRKEDKVSVGLTVLFIVLQLIPVVDVIVTTVILSNYKKRIESKDVLEHE